MKNLPEFKFYKYINLYINYLSFVNDNFKIIKINLKL